MSLNNIVLLLKLGYDPLLNRRKVLVLQPCELHQFLSPHWLDVAVLSGSADDGTGNQVLVGVNNLMVLQAQQRKEVDVLFHEGHGLLVGLDRVYLAVLLV